MEAEPVTDRDAPCANHAVVVGELVTEPEFGTLPGGTERMNFSLTVRQPGEATTSVPLIWYDPPKRVHRWKTGARLVASGPIVRRFYKAGGGTGSRTEIVVRRAENVRQRSRARSILSGLAATVDEVVERLE